MSHPLHGGYGDPEERRFGGSGAPLPEAEQWRLFEGPRRETYGPMRSGALTPEILAAQQAGIPPRITTAPIRATIPVQDNASIARELQARLEAFRARQRVPAVIPPQTGPDYPIRVLPPLPPAPSYPGHLEPDMPMRTPPDTRDIVPRPPPKNGPAYTRADRTTSTDLTEILRSGIPQETMTEAEIAAHRAAADAYNAARPWYVSEYKRDRYGRQVFTGRLLPSSAEAPSAFQRLEDYRSTWTPHEQAMIDFNLRVAQEAEASRQASLPAITPEDRAAHEARIARETELRIRADYAADLQQRARDAEIEANWNHPDNAARRHLWDQRRGRAPIEPGGRQPSLLRQAIFDMADPPTEAFVPRRTLFERAGRATARAGHAIVEATRSYTGETLPSMIRGLRPDAARIAGLAAARLAGAARAVLPPDISVPAMVAPTLMEGAAQIGQAQGALDAQWIRHNAPELANANLSPDLLSRIIRRYSEGQRRLGATPSGPPSSYDLDWLGRDRR